MRWLNSISELQYYNQDPNLPCYCEHVVNPTDLILQGEFSMFGVDPYTHKIELLSPDGLTVYEDVSSSFSVWFGINPETGNIFFNARLNSFSDEMCDKKCWILRVQIWVVGIDVIFTAFDKYTERYCQTDCCATASGVTIGENLVSNAPVPQINSPLTADCGRKLIRLVTKNDCYDPFSNEYYGVPPVVLQGTADFSLVKVSVFKGRMVQRPREIIREITYNCNLQKSESRKPFLLEGFEFMPTWKMNEIENQLHAKEIWIDDYPNYNQYQFYGGVVFEKVEGARNCDEIWKLAATLEECPVRRYFGCDEPCEGTPGALDFNQFFVIPEGYEEGQPFYNDAKSVVGYNLTDLLDYLRNQEGVTAAELVSASPALDCSFEAIIGMAGSFLPNSIYIGTASPASRTFAVSVDDISDICSFIPGQQCPAPVLASVQGIENACSTPVLDYMEAEVVSPVSIDITGYGNWTIDSESAEVGNLQVQFSLSVTNTTIPPGAGEVINLAGEIIGIMGAAGRPSIDVILNSSNNPNLSDEQTITIDTYGVIRYSGEPTTYNEGVSIEIELTGLIYNI